MLISIDSAWSYNQLSVYLLSVQQVQWVQVALGVPLTGAFKLTNSSFSALSIALSNASKCELASFALFWIKMDSSLLHAQG